MALVLNDRVKETTTTTGTGTVNLAGAEIGFEGFVAGIGNSNTCYYTIAHQSANEFEVGLGTVTDASPDTLSRTTIISSSNSDSAVNFSAGTKDVFCTLPASKAVFEDASDNIVLGAAPTVTNASGDLTFDVVGSIILDADNNGEVSFQDAGTEIGKIFNSSSDFAFEAGVQDKDIIFKGNDGGTGITALTLDMSAAGAATFNSSVTHKGSTASSASNFISSWNSTGQSYYGYLYADSGGTGIFSHSSAAIQEGIYFQNSTDKTIFYNQGAARGQIDGSGNVIFVGNITAYGSTSDIRLKENIEIISNPLDKVKKLKGVTFNYKKDGKKSTGLIAQDLEKVLPEAVYESSDIDDDDDKHLAIRYGNTVGLLVEAIKEQQEQIETLTAKVKELEDK
tara:strand:+ start:14727 stop:15911 length:1185 start_codon:yes stop_codon:yes gene_type:complete